MVTTETWKDYFFGDVNRPFIPENPQLLMQRFLSTKSSQPFNDCGFVRIYDIFLMFSKNIVTFTSRNATTWI